MRDGKPNPARPGVLWVDLWPTSCLRVPSACPPSKTRRGDWRTFMSCPEVVVRLESKPLQSTR